MTIVHVLLGFVICCLVGALGYILGEMQGQASGYSRCLGEIDEDEDSRKVWRAAR